MATTPISNRKKLSRILAQIADLQAQVVVLEPLAAAEPEEFDGSAVVVGSNVIVEVTKDKVVSQVKAQVLGVKRRAEGEKGPGVLIKVQIGIGFDAETRVVYPGDIIGYAPVNVAAPQVAA